MQELKESPPTLILPDDIKLKYGLVSLGKYGVEIIKSEEFQALQQVRFQEKELIKKGGKAFKENFLKLLFALGGLHGFIMLILFMVHPEYDAWKSIITFFFGVMFLLMIYRVCEGRFMLDDEITAEEYDNLRSISQYHPPTLKYITEQIKQNKKLTLRDLHYLSYWELCHWVGKIAELQIRLEKRDSITQNRQGQIQ